MRANAVRWHKTDGVQGYHLVQSFAEGEVTPELAHKIGLELAERVLGGRYQAIVTTHLNTSHYHNHIVWSSVAMNSGRKYHSNAKSYALEIRAVSDELCVKYGLSIIQTDAPRRYQSPTPNGWPRKTVSDLAHGDPAGCGCRAGRSADVAAVYTRTGKQGLRAEF